MWVIDVTGLGLVDRYLGIFDRLRVCKPESWVGMEGV